MHLFSVLSDFEPPRLASVPRAEAAAVQLGRLRADTHKQTAQLHAELITRYAAGATVKVLAAKHGLHHLTVGAALVRAGVLVRTRQRLAPADIEQIARLYQTGLSTSEIGAQFNVYASTIGRQLMKLGIELRAPARRPLRLV